MDIAGQTFGRLTAVEEVEVSAERTHWRCRCTCGRVVIAESWKIRTGYTKSCGCLSRDVGAAALTTHGHYGTPEYRVWRGIKTRCYNANDKRYDRYGERGISMCDRWRSDFLAFLADMGPRPSPKHSIERRDNNRGYEPDNCYWATATEQNRNKSSSHRITFRGETRTLIEWEAITGINHQAISARIRRYGWSAERALTEPPKVGRRRSHAPPAPAVPRRVRLSSIAR